MKTGVVQCIGMLEGDFRLPGGPLKSRKLKATTSKKVNKLKAWFTGRRVSSFTRLVPWGGDLKSKSIFITRL